MAGQGRAGRRPGDSGTRDAIAAAARRQFAELGYDRTTLRGIAREAGVDAALVTHFHGTKHQLFASVVELPYDPAEVLPAILAGDPATVGLRLARFVVTLLESEARPRLVGLVRAAATEPEAARVVRDLIATRILAAMVAHLDAPDAPLRAALVGSQIVGLVMARHVVAVEPLASTDPDDLVAVLAPTLQRYLSGPLAGAPGDA